MTIMSNVKQNRLIVSLMAVLSLSACGGADQQDLSSWMEVERNSIRTQIEPLAEPKTFKPLPYPVVDLLEPFSGERLIRILQGGKDASTGSSALIQAEENRRKQPLEAHPLDAIFMVGSLFRDGQPVALVKVNNLLYQITIGRYMGQNYGRVTSITENEMVLREVVQDPSGEWIERSATLQLTEESSK